MKFSSPFAAATLLSVAALAQATSQFSIESDEAIRKTSSLLAWDMLQYYRGNLSGHTPGILPGPPPAGDYYWWQAGAMWGALIDYWHWTGDSTYNDLVMQSMQFQVGEGKNYMPINVTASLGNDDQAFWGMAALRAAEYGFPNPPPDRPSWLGLAQTVFETQASPDRHDKTCGGGLRWQIPFANNGYDYKNSIANGCLFNMGARLARYTGNKTYADWAVRTWDWMEEVGFLNKKYGIYDGANVTTNCTAYNKAEFSYNNAVFAEGAAFMYNFTGLELWKSRTERLVDYGLGRFLPDGIAIESACENTGCKTDMYTYKGFFHRWYATITQIAPFLGPKILPPLKTSAQAAIKQCTGGALGRQCGFKWLTGVYDGNTGHGQEMSVLGAVSALLIEKATPPMTIHTGGTSKEDTRKPGAWSSESRRATVADKVGAGFLTVILMAVVCGMLGWISI
ncbi:hypothetical protein RJ55_06403 [Drechmeria coniospora]|nr:hypothetical protein RJ55_06403 [Drechmeria coniospora]